MEDVIRVKLSADTKVYGVIKKKDTILKLTKKAFEEIKPKGEIQKPSKRTKEK